MIPSTVEEIELFVTQFDAGALPKSKWTHHAHLLVGLWYLTHRTFDEALDALRQKIRAHNIATGTPNTDHSGYHETLTRLYLRGIAAHHERHSLQPLPESFAELRQSPLGDKEWPLRFYSKARLFSVEARRGWVEPDVCDPL